MTDGEVLRPEQSICLKTGYMSYTFLQFMKLTIELMGETYYFKR